ncbi:hypothetical protein [Trueperella pyogenes]|uniref:hypothetical protein n=1 Tax=Trueperella pyogenes TaxID=1661 RepID=UPI00345DE82B
MKTTPAHALAALHKAPVADPIVAGTAGTASHASSAAVAGNYGKASSSVKASNASKAGNLKKFTIRMDEQLLGRIRAAYLRDLTAGRAPSSLSAWAAAALETAVTQSETNYNHGQQWVPVASDVVPKGPMQ